jgi:hypothetical protein
MQMSMVALAATLLGVSAVSAQTQTFSLAYDYSLAEDGDVYPRLTIPGFDDKEGDRTLTRVEVRVQTHVSGTMAIENRTNAPLSGWTLTGEHTILTGFERENPTEFGPFAFLGGLLFPPLSGDLAAADGTDGAGTDFLSVSDSVSIDSILEMDESYLDFFSGGGEIFAVVGPFTEHFLEDAQPYDPTLGIGDATVQFTDLAQVGTFSVIYHYNVVPEPATLMALGALFPARRRRR